MIQFRDSEPVIKPKRICMVAYTHYRTDPRCRREAEALAARGDEVDFICLGSPSEAGKELIDGVTIRRLRMGRYRGNSASSYILSYALFFIRASILLTALSFKRRYDVVHVHTLPDFMVFVAAFPRLLGSKVILDLHELSPELFSDRFGLPARHILLRLLRAVESTSVRWADRVVLCTNAQSKFLGERCAPKNPVSVLMNLPDPRYFGASRGRTPARFPRERFKIVHHGTLVRRNGVGLAIEAFARVSEKIPRSELHIYGNGDSLNELREQVLALSLGDRVHLPGELLPMEVLVSLLRDADVGVVPNLDGPVMKLALPTKLLEYMALEIPVVAARTPAMTEYFDDSMVLFFEPGDEAGLARCILKLYEEPELRRSLARNALRFLDKHNWETEKTKLFSLVDGLAA